MALNFRRSLLTGKQIMKQKNCCTCWTWCIDGISTLETMWTFLYQVLDGHVVQILSFSYFKVSRANCMVSIAESRANVNSGSLTQILGYDFFQQDYRCVPIIKTSIVRHVFGGILSGSFQPNSTGVWNWYLCLLLCDRYILKISTSSLHLFSLNDWSKFYGLSANFQFFYFVPIFIDSPF